MFYFSVDVSEALYKSPPAIPSIKLINFLGEVLLASNCTVAILSVKTTVAEATPSFFESLDSIVLAQPISQVIPEMLNETVSNFAAIFSFTASFLHDVNEKEKIAKSIKI